MTSGRALTDLLCPELFRSLADPVRLQIVARLAWSPTPLTVTEVADCCGRHLSGVSRHLALLKRAGVVDATRDGRAVRYDLRRAELASLLRRLAAALERPGACCAADGPTTPSRGERDEEDEDGDEHEDE